MFKPVVASFFLGALLPGADAACVTMVDGPRQYVLAESSTDSATNYKVYTAVDPRSGTWKEEVIAWYDVTTQNYFVGPPSRSYDELVYMMEDKLDSDGCFKATAAAWYFLPGAMKPKARGLSYGAAASGVHTLCVPRQGKLVGGSRLNLGTTTGLMECAAKAIARYPTGLVGVMRDPWSNLPDYGSGCWAYFGVATFVPEVDFNGHSSCVLTDLNLMPGSMEAKTSVQLEPAEDQATCVAQAHAKYPGAMVGMSWNAKTKECWGSDSYTGVDVSTAGHGWLNAISYVSPLWMTTTTTSTTTSTTTATTTATTPATTTTAAAASSRTAIYIAIGVGVPVALTISAVLGLLAWRRCSAREDEFSAYPGYDDLEY